MFCKYCGKEHEGNIFFCTSCGKSVNDGRSERVVVVQAKEEKKGRM